MSDRRPDPGTYVELDDAWSDPGWTRIPNLIIRDRALSLGAKGLVAELASNDPGFRMTIDDLIAQSTDGRDAHRARFTELTRRGYLIKRQERDRFGRLGAVVFRLFVTPQNTNPQVIPATAFPATAHPATANPTSSKKTKFNEDQKPKEDSKSSITATAANASDSNDELLLPGMPAPASKPAVKPSHDEEEAAFARWWTIYPRKVGKLAARKAWASVLRQRLADIETLTLGAKRYAEACSHDPKYVKHPSTWLAGGHWADELLPTPAATPRNGHTPYSDTGSDADYEGPLQ
jgi:hypothetical protein